MRDGRLLSQTLRNWASEVCRPTLIKTCAIATSLQHDVQGNASGYQDHFLQERSIGRC